MGLLLGAPACTDDVLDAPYTDATPPPDCPPGVDAGGAEGLLNSKTFVPTEADFSNPERGMDAALDMLESGWAEYIRDELGFTMAHGRARLEEYRDRPLDDALLATLRTSFDEIRTARIKVVLRFSYAGRGPDAPKGRILEHIEQLAPLLDANADVIAAMDAGFIGAYGEWHDSTNGLDNPTDRADILEAELRALPEGRAVSIRTPMLKDEILPGGPIEEEEAFRGTDRSRVAHHNDCFLASADDEGTYADPIEFWKEYVAQEGRFTPVGGETCQVNPPRSDCPQALEELAALHWSYLNYDNDEVLDTCRAAGCYDEIARRLGYRLVLSDASWTAAAPPGGVLALRVGLRNEGFAALYNARPVYVVLSDGVTRWAARLGVDPRRWEPNESVCIEPRLGIPEEAQPGTYRLSLWLPDEAESLRDVADYAVRFANEGVWEASTGYNLLTDDFVIDPDALGAVDASAPEVIELAPM